MRVFLPRFLLCLILSVLMTMVSACGNATKPVMVGVLSSELPLPVPTLSLAGEQNFGYVRAQADTGATATAQADPKSQAYTALQMGYQLENDPQVEISMAVRKLVEDKDQPAIALLGATSNERSMRLASLANAFAVPLIIPSNAGDGLLPSNNAWGFRLSAPGEAHARHLFGSVLSRAKVSTLGNDDEDSFDADSLGESGKPKPFKVAIFYEQDTFGESAAVVAAKSAMEQEMEIGFYGSFDPTRPDPKRLSDQAEVILEQGVHLIYFIGSQPKTVQTVIQILRDEIPEAERPVLLGQSGAFSSLEFIDTPEAQGMFVLRQKIISKNCPKEIKSLTQAQSYAAVALLYAALRQAKENVGDKYVGLSIAQKREALKDVLKTMNEDLKCVGRVSFDTSGQNKNQEFEILQITSTGLVLIDADAFREILKPIYNRSPFDIGQ